MYVTEFGIMIDDKDLQPENKYSLIFVNVLGSSIVVRLSQPEKAYLPIDITDEGMTTDFSDSQP